MAELIFKEEFYKIIGLCMEVHRHLGPGLLEIVYKDALEYEIKINNIPYAREKEFIIEYKNIVLPHKYYADFVVFDNIILEVKAVKGLAEDFTKLVLNYMILAKSRLGILVNFGENSLQYKRYIL
jgi:GxxExxY protein